MGEPRSSRRKGSRPPISPRRAPATRSPGEGGRWFTPATESPALAALRRGREAIIEIDHQLDEVLVWLRDPVTGLDIAVPERLARSARRAGEALAGITPSHAIF